MAQTKQKNTDTKPVENKEKKEEVVTPVSLVPPVVAEVKKAPRAKPAVKVVALVPEVVPPKPEEAVKEPVVEPVTGDDKELPASTENVIQVLTDKINVLTALVKEIVLAHKQVVKSYDKNQKVIDKIQKKRENARKSPSGFAKPNKISDELCDFIGVPHGTEKSRTDITRYINNYVKEHNLNKPTNRRIILPDDKLRAILNVKNDEEVTFFILQRLISHHFPPKNVK